MKHDAFQSAIDALLEGSPPRVWSLIVTVFGDLAQTQGEAISGPVLGTILNPLGIKPEAMRVALHRLRNEGWLAARKDGRLSLHQLEPYGLSLSAQASGRIYRRSYAAHGNWHILCTPPDQRVDLPPSAPTYVQLCPGVHLAHANAPDVHGDFFVLQGAPHTFPDWIMQAALPKGLTSELKDLHAALDVFLSELDAGDTLPAQQAACLRVLIVHRWRRLILKVPNVPDDLFGHDWIGHACRDLVHHALDRLPRPALSDLA